MNEVSLKDLIQIIWKYKLLVGIITVVCIVLGAVFYIFIPGEKYRAEAVLMIQPFADDIKETDIDTIPEIVEYLAENPAFSIETYVEQLLLAPVMNKVADKMGIDKSNENYLNKLRKRITFHSPENSNLVYIQYTDKEPNKAIEGANAITEAYIDYISGIVKLQAETAIEFISAQLVTENQNVDEALANLTEFLAKPRGVDELQGELNDTLESIISYKNQINTLEIDISYYEEGLAAASNQLEKTPEVFTVIKAIGDDAEVALFILSENNQEITDMSDIVMIEQIPNEAYIELAKTVNLYEIQVRMYKVKLVEISKTLEQLQSEIKILQTELALKKSESDYLYEAVNSTKVSRDLYENELKTAETKLVADIGKKSIIKIADAQNSESASTNKLLVLILSAFVGVVIGILISFIINAWKSDEKSSKEKELSQT
jgi:uncharacterized protein involved in exopolysaccharide biosynthesis